VFRRQVVEIEGVPGLFVSIVVPCYQSARTLPALVARLTEVMPGATTAYEVILVVDGSTDETWDVAHGLALRIGPVRAIRLARNYGQHNALIAGVRAARYDVVVTMDDDLQHPPEEVPKLLAALTDDVDLVYAVPENEEHGAVRNLASRLIKTGLSGPMGVKDAKVVGAFRAFRTFLRGGFDTISGPHVSVDVALSWGTTRIAAATVHLDERTTGRSGYTARKLFKHALNMILGYSVTPLRLVTLLGFLIGLGGLVLFARLLWLYLRGETTIAGFTTIASMIALFSSAQMVAIGVLGEYVGRIHSHGMGRPTYVIRERTEGGEAPDEIDSLASGAITEEPSQPR
jgi:undecaprenyl-phosphate 4-deoxy-4-formamido-L-arabinose transferase